MQKTWANPLFFVSSFSACAVLSLATGCASGGFHLTREYAGWVNSQNVILRVVLYILTSVVFAVTLLLDMVIFNTMDFWDGKVSAGSYEFKGDNKVFHVRHEFLPGSKLKKSTINIADNNGRALQQVVLSETATGEIEMFVDGNLRSRVKSLSSLPKITQFDTHGKFVDENYILFSPAVGITALK